MSAFRFILGLLETCSLCEGKGWYGGMGWDGECDHCGGTGKVRVNRKKLWWEKRA